MSQKDKKHKIEIAVADAGPLITLAKVNALDLLLVFEDKVRVVITDFVEFEVTKDRELHHDAKAVSDFIIRNAGKVEIRETSIGKTMKQMALVREAFENSDSVRKALISSNAEPPRLPKDIGELSIVSFAKEVIDSPPGTPILILAEDDFFLNTGSSAPGNAHVLSTRAFLETLAELGFIRDLETLWAEIVQLRPNVEEKTVDREAKKIKTTWVDSIDENKARRAGSKIGSGPS